MTLPELFQSLILSLLMWVLELLILKGHYFLFYQYTIFKNVFNEVGFCVFTWGGFVWVFFGGWGGNERWEWREHNKQDVLFSIKIHLSVVPACFHSFLKREVDWETEALWRFPCVSPFLPTDEDDRLLHKCSVQPAAHCFVLLHLSFCVLSAILKGAKNLKTKNLQIFSSVKVLGKQHSGNQYSTLCCLKA